MINIPPHGIMFHHFHKKGITPGGQGSMTDEQFDNIIIFLKRKFNLLTARSWLEKALNHGVEKGDICLTFDDNLLCQYEIAVPVLKSYDLTGFWFVYSSPLIGKLEKLELYRYFRCVMFEDITAFYKEFFSYAYKHFHQKIDSVMKNFDPNVYLRAFPFYSVEDKRFRYIRDEILGEKNYNLLMDKMIQNSQVNLSDISKKIWFGREIIGSLYKSGHIIGLHSHTHPTRIGLLSYTKQYKEYKTNLNILTDITGDKICVAAHPTNSYNEMTFKVFERLGILIGFRSNMEEGFISRYEFPRLDHALLNLLITK